ncbi:mechanosensitive ion channel family protein [Variovorax ureilyticus]|uniref:mechanosensitive ion channel family protein n=1 Tax=Variovorax ureilyticus TaxID=1836198 RepID=UPI003D67CAF7
MPNWTIEWLEIIVPTAEVALIMLGAWLLYRIVRRLVERVARSYTLPSNVATVTRRTAGFLIYGGAVLWSLERLGASGEVLWTAFTGFATVGAVAFFAAWSVLSNMFCALLIFTTRMFWPGDTVEVLENGEKPGLKGRVLDINLVFTTLEETGDAQQGTTLKIPNSMFFQRAVRRWHGSAPPLPATLAPTTRSDPSGIQGH